MKEQENQNESKLKLIPVALANKMINAYEKQRRQPASQQLTKELGVASEDSRLVWVSKEAILELLKLNDADGIRFYFAIADDYTGYKLRNPEYKKRHTLVMVATKSKDPKNPTLENSVDCLEIPRKPKGAGETKSGKVGPIIMPMSGSGANMPADDLGMCPPPHTGPEGALLPYDETQT